MELIPVLDVRAGVAVRADGGPRSGYRELRSVLAAGADPRRLARAMRERLGLARLYVADLDAIEAGAGLRHKAGSLVRDLTTEGARVWIDAGVATPTAVEPLLEAGAERVLVGLETLPDLDRLAELVETIGAERLAFSLDLRDGRLLAPRLGSSPPVGQVARDVVEARFTAVVVLDLGRVGRGTGPMSGGPAALGAPGAGVRWHAGGGVRDVADLELLAKDGWDGCLVGSAIHAGRIVRGHVEAMCGARASRGRSPTVPATPRPRSRAP